MRKGTALIIVLVFIVSISLLLPACKSSSSTTTTTAAAVTTKSTTTSAVTSSVAPVSTSPTATSPTSTTPAASPTQTAAPSSTVTPQKGGVLTIISNNVPTTWGYPVKAGAGFAPIFAGLPELEGFIDADVYGNILPKLATSWVIAPDKSSITFTLRKGVKFHDGTSFDADAAKWNLDLYLARGTGSPADWKSVEVVDLNTVRINLKSFKNTQLSNMTYLMISPTAVQKNGADWAGTNPVGTGPFKFKGFVPNTSLEFTRFDDYWGDKALVDGIKYIYITDTTTASMAYKGGDALVWESPDPKGAADLVKNGYQAFKRLGPNMVLVPDGANPDSPWSKLKVRQALEYAIDKQSIVDAFGFGLWQSIYQPNVPTQFGYVPDLAPQKYDPAKAKQLLADAGYPNGFATKIITSATLEKDPLVSIQDNLKAIGITVTIEVQAASKWAETRTGGWSNGLFFVTNGATDFNYCAYLERYFTPTSAFVAKSMYYPDGWVDLVTKMMLLSDQTQMAAAAQQAVKTEVSNEMVVPLWQEQAVYIANKTVHDMGIGTHGDGFSWNTTKVWISK